MPRVTFLPAGETFEFDKGKLSYKGHGKPESLLDIAMNFGFHLEHACGGSCACTTCHVVVKEGLDAHLTPADEDEEDRVDIAADLTPHSRLGWNTWSRMKPYPRHADDTVFSVSDRLWVNHPDDGRADGQGTSVPGLSVPTISRRTQNRTVLSGLSA